MRQRLNTLAAVTLALGLMSDPALAHSKKEATQPPDGAALAVAPDVIGMRFDLPMRITVITLKDAKGGEYALTRTDAMAPVTTFQAIPDDLPQGQFTIEWRGLSSDGHPMEERFSFGIKG